MDNYFEHTVRSLMVGATLFTEKMDPVNLASARSNARSELTAPANTEMAILPDFIRIIYHSNVDPLPKPYWLRDRRYDPLEVFISTIEFFDRHQQPLPQTTIPPERDVKKFIDIVLSSDHKLTVADQLEYLLRITNGNISGAANIGFLACRLLARGWDTRVFPSIPITPLTIRLANNHMAPFETEKPGSDAPGDNYYFWTHFFAAYVYDQLGCHHSQILNKIFAIGTPVMRFVRKYFVGQPTISEHMEASILGRHMGISISNLSDYFCQQK